MEQEKLLIRLMKENVFLSNILYLKNSLQYSMTSLVSLSVPIVFMTLLFFITQDMPISLLIMLGSVLMFFFYLSITDLSDNIKGKFGSYELAFKVKKFFKKNKYSKTKEGALFKSIKDEKDLFDRLMEDLNEGEIRENLNKIIVYAIMNDVYPELEKYGIKININDKYVYNLIIKEDMVNKFILSFPKSERLKVFFSKDFQDSLLLMDKNKAHEAKKNIVNKNIREYIKNGSGYDKELYMLAQEVGVSRDIIYELRNMMVENEKVEKINKSLLDNDNILKETNQLKNNNIINF